MNYDGTKVTDTGFCFEFLSILQCRFVIMAVFLSKIDKLVIF